jgi:hypothetical protein
MKRWIDVRVKIERVSLLYMYIYVPYFKLLDLITDESDDLYFFSILYPGFMIPFSVKRAWALLLAKQGLFGTCTSR